MLNLFEITPKKTPDFFYLPSTPGVFDIIFEEITFDEGKSFRKKAKNKTTQDLHVYNDVTKLYHGDTLLCESKLFMDKFADSQWQYYDFDKSDVSIIENDDKKIKAFKKIDANEFEIIAEFYGGNPKTERSSKQVFRLKGNENDIIRGRWFLRAYSLDDLIVDYSDYEGNTSDTGWIYDEINEWWERTIIFEPDGVLEQLIVDPYLSVDEQASQITVYLDGSYVVVYDNSSSDYSMRIYDDLDNHIGTMSPFFNHESKRWHMHRHADIHNMELIEDTGTRVVIRATGHDFYENSAAEWLNDDPTSPIENSGWIIYYIFYSDIMILRFEMISDNDNEDLSSSYFECYITAGGDNNDPWNFGEDADVEYTHEENGVNNPDLRDQNRNDYEYAGFGSNEANIQIIKVEDCGTATWNTYYGNHGQIHQRIGATADFDAGLHHFTIACIIDSAQRETVYSADYGSWDSGTEYTVGDIVTHNSTNYEAVNTHTNNEPGVATYWGRDWIQVHGYNRADRQNLSKKFRNATPATINTGTAVTDCHIPDNIDSDGWNIFDERRIDHSSQAAKLTFGQTEIRPVVTLPNWGVFTGSGQTDHVVGHWKCDDNAASRTILATTGSNGEIMSGGANTEDIDSTDAVRGTSLLLDGTNDIIDLSTGFGDLTSVLAFTVGFYLKPNFAENVGSNQYMFAIREAWDNQIYMWYDQATDIIKLKNYIGGSDNGDISLFQATSDNDLQQWHYFSLAVDLNNDRIFALWNGKVKGTFTETDNWSYGNPDKLYIGSRDGSTEFTAMAVDEVILLDGCLIPFGAYFTGNGSVDASVAHDDILFHWDGSDCTGSNVSIGGVQGTKGGSGGTFQTSGGLGNNDDYFDTEGTANLSFPITSQDIIDFNTIGILIPFQIQTIGVGDAIFGVGDADDYFQAVMDASGNIDVTYRSNSTSETITGDIACAVGEDHFLLIKVDDTDQVQCFIDGVENGTAQTIANVWDGITSGTLYFGADYAGSNIADIFIHNVTITNNPHTPQIPTIFGKPIWVPEHKVNGGSLEQHGDTFDYVFLNDLGILITCVDEDGNVALNDYWEFADEFALPATTVQLSGSIDIVTTTSAASLEVQRQLSGSADIVSITSNVILEVQRQLSGSIDIATLTSSPELLLAIQLAGTIAITSTTSVPALAVQRQLSGSADIQTATSSVILEILRQLSGSVDIITATSQPNLAVQRQLVGSVDIISITSDVRLGILRELSGLIAMQTQTPSLELIVNRQLSALVEILTSTSEPALNIQRQLSGSIDIASLTSAFNLLVSVFGIVEDTTIELQTGYSVTSDTADLTITAQTGYTTESVTRAKTIEEA